MLRIKLNPKPKDTFVQLEIVQIPPQFLQTSFFCVCLTIVLMIHFYVKCEVLLEFFTSLSELASLLELLKTI